MNKLTRYSAPLVLLLLGACVTVPTGPSVMAMPGTGKNFDQFRADDFECRQYALGQIGGATANDAAVDSTVRSAALGTVVGAVAGAAIGGHQGAGVGAGTGLLMGTMAGASAGQASGYGTQRRYDNAYVQCMYAKGERVPVSGRLMSAPARAPMQAPAPAQAQAPSQAPGPMPSAAAPPPPPPGYPPPPPPGVVR